MKALKITIIALLAGFSMVSCDFLDKEPTKTDAGELLQHPR